MNKHEILKNKPIYLGLSILELGKILMYRFQYDHVKPKYGEKAKLQTQTDIYKNRWYL